MNEQTVAVSGLAGSSSVAARSARRWWVLGVVGLAQLMVILDATIVNIALPSAQRSLGFSNADRQYGWSPSRRPTAPAAALSRRPWPSGSACPSCSG